MRYLLLLGTLLTLFSCSPEQDASSKNALSVKSGQLTRPGISSLEGNALKAASTSNKHQLTKVEIESLYKENLISKAEYNELLSLSL